MPKRTITAQDVPNFLEMLACSDPITQQNALSALCPCRSRCDDHAIWTAICHAFDSPESPSRVKDQAFHALETLVNKAKTNPEAEELLNWLVEQRLLLLPLERADVPRNRDGSPRRPQENLRVTSRDVPRLVETIHCGDTGDQQHALMLACPCRNRRYDKELWLAIFRAYAESDDAQVRDQAVHAIGTLRERARTDPRSQKLLLWLEAQGVASPSLTEAVPTWQPGGRAGLNGLYIPRFERSPRSKANRRRR